MQQAWTFADTLGSKRVQNLSSASSSFAELLEDVFHSAEVLCIHRQGCGDIKEFSRVVATVKVPPDTFDRFFNSQSGYRGAFAKSPYEGLRSNDQALRKLIPLLLAHHKKSASPLDRDFLKESLASASAKLWLSEVGLHLCECCRGEWDSRGDTTPEIFNGLWDAAGGVEAGWGRKAPYLTKLKLIGAFLNSQYDEFVPSHKRKRADQIHRCGWA